ncbi:MAG: CocE/NonD family hydrolase, partial [Myxococcota bacterium]
MRAPQGHTGAFRFEDGTTVVFAARDDGCLRVVRSDGRVGKVCPSLERAGSYVGASRFSGKGPDPIDVTFEAERLTLSWGEKSQRPAKRVPDRRVDVSFFASDKRELSGELIVPPGTSPVPVIVHVGGSERSGAVGQVWLPYMLAAHGVASFVYDKRGVGGSEGEYSQDLHLLGADAEEAIKAARGAIGERLGAVGIIGFSQGGWVAPLAAASTKVDAVAVGFGLAVSPLREEVSEVTARIANAGHNEAIVAAAGEFAEQCARVANTDFAEGVDQLGAMKADAERDGWLGDVGGDGITGALAQNPVFFVDLLWGLFDTDTT